MTLIFLCPATGQAFSSSHYSIVANKGVVMDDQGNRILDAKVVLTDPCPHCGEHHGYQAADLACPCPSPVIRVS